MRTGMRYARRFVLFALLLLLLVYEHGVFARRGMMAYFWHPWIPGQEALRIFIVALYAVVGLGIFVSGFKAWFIIRKVTQEKSPFIRDVCDLGFLRAAAKRWRMPGFVLGARLAFGALFIALLLLALWSERSLDSAEWKVIPPRLVELPMTDGTASIVFSLGTPDNSMDHYLTCVQRLAADLVAAGAKVVVCAVPDTAFTVRSFPLVDSIAQMKNVVIFDGRARLMSVPVRMAWSDPQFDRLPMFTGTTDEYERGVGSVQAWHPFLGFISEESHFNERQIRMDVAMAAAGRYLDIPRNTRPSPEGNALVYGSLLIPVTSSGVAYSRTSQFRFAEVSALASLRENGTLVMQYHQYPDWESHDEFPRSSVPRVAGKIVIVHWLQDDPFGFRFDQNAGMIWRIQSITESLIHQRFLRTVGWLSLALFVITIVSSVIVMAKLRLRWAVILTLLLGSALFAAGIYSVGQFHLILMTGYSLAAAVACALVLPYIRLVHERGEFRTVQ